MSNPPEAAATTDEGSADGAVVGTKRKAEDSTLERDASEVLHANGLQIDRTEGPPGKSSVCRVEGCDVVFSTAH